MVPIMHYHLTDILLYYTLFTHRSQFTAVKLRLRLTLLITTRELCKIDWNRSYDWLFPFLAQTKNESSFTLGILDYHTANLSDCYGLGYGS